MALNFPDNPTLGEIYIDNTSGFSYEWDGYVWISYTGASTSNIKLLDNISGLFDNVTLSFPLTVNGQAVVTATSKQLLISVGGVIQNPSVDFDVVGSNVVFTTAPIVGLSFFGTLLGSAQTEQVSVYNKQSYSPVGVQTNFTFSTGYTVGYLDVFRNGVRLISGSDFTASDGSTFTLSPPAQNGDDIEAVGFNVDVVTSIDGNITNLNVSNNTNIVGVTTLNILLTITSGGANITGVVTASSFVGNLTGTASVSQGLTGSPNIIVGVVTATTVEDSLGNLRSIPQNAKASAYNLAASDNGKHISITTGGISVLSGIFSIGDTVAIYNNSGSNQTITQGASVTLRQAGTGNTGNRNLAQYGICTILCVASNTFVISGTGIS
jgi:hypothetical protein